MDFLRFILSFFTAFFGGVILNDVKCIKCRRFRLHSRKVKKDVRFVAMSDLHAREFGKGNRRLIREIESLKPDFVLMAGDIMTAKDVGKRIERSVRIASDLIRELTKICPVYFALGNHESRVLWDPERFTFDYEGMLSDFREAGAVILDNDDILLRDFGVRIYGLTLSVPYYFRLSRPKHLFAGTIRRRIGGPDPESFNILLAHHPDYLPSYAAWGADLSFSGHYHGGIMRLPFLGGVISPKPCLFPKYSGGMYRLRGLCQYVLCGTGYHSIPVRVFNPAELVCVELKKQEGS